MARIHTLRDFTNEDNNYDQTRTMQTRYDSRCNRQSTLIDLIFPNFKILSFIFIISMIQISCFIVDQILMFNLNKRYLEYYFHASSKLFAHGQIWRLITPILSHLNFLHLSMNIFFQMRLGFSIENDLKIKKTMILYFLSAAGGNLGSFAFASPRSAEGASTSGFGLIGAQFANIYLLWETINNKQQIVSDIIFFVFIALIMSLGDSRSIDSFGHFGGFITGFMIYIIMNSKIAIVDFKKIKLPKYVIALLISYFLLSICLINVRNFSPYN